MPKVLIADELSPRAVAVFAERGIDAVTRIGLKPDELAAVIGEYRRAGGALGDQGDAGADRRRRAT